jgi:RNA polymerase sigma-70 factor (ECF subfamily)
MPARVMDEKPKNPDGPADESVKGASAAAPASGQSSAQAMAQSGAGLTTEQLFEKAVADHSRRLLGVARGIVGNRASPEDVVQQAVMNLYQHRARYDWREPGGLLRRAVVNEALRILRQPRMTAMEEDYHGATSSPPEAGLIDRETVLQVRRAIEKLPENFKAALVLCEYEKMPYAQIATTLNASIPQVKTWIFRARRQLAEMLKDVAGPGT